MKSQIRRRSFLTLLGGAATFPILQPLAVRAQRSDVIKRLGILRGIVAIELQEPSRSSATGPIDNYPGGFLLHW
jgi:hypothetical protein